MDERGTYITAWAAAALVAAAATPLSIWLARTWGLVDEPNARKVHAHATPRVGGLAIALALFGVAVPLLLASLPGATPAQVGRLGMLLAAALVVFACGLMDDLMDIPSRYKLLVLVAAALALCGSGVRIDSVGGIDAVWLELGWLAWPATVLFVIGVTVSVNFIDGLDGLAAGIVAVAGGVLALALVAHGRSQLAVVVLALLGALCGFLPWNSRWAGRPARTFMGDGGSMFIGFLLAGCCVAASPTLGTMRGLLLPSLALSVPIVDAALTLVRRSVLQRRSIWSAERGHVHHRLLDLGLGHGQAVWCLYGVTVAAAGVGVLALYAEGWATFGGLALVAPLLVGLFRTSGSVRARETLTAMRRLRAMRRTDGRYRLAFENLQLGFHEVASFGDWWEHVCDAAERLDFVRAEIEVPGRDGRLRRLEWVREDGRLAACETMNVTVPVPERRAGGALRVGVHVAVCDCLESAARRVALFSRLLAEQSLAQLDRGRRAAPAPGRKSRPAAAGAAKGAEIDLMSARFTPPGLPRVAIVHDFLYTYAGAERVLEQMLEVFPHADLFSLFDFLPPDGRAFLRDKRARTSFLQRLPFVRGRHRAFLALMPVAIEQLDVSGYDVVLSSSYCVAKGVLTGPDQRHVCYCHSPARFAWDLQPQCLAGAGLAGRGGIVGLAREVLARSLLHYFRIWDFRSAAGVDAFLCNSDFVGRRIEKAYRRTATTLYPPVDVEGFPLREDKDDFYVTAGRLVPYKRVDLILQAFARMPQRRLVVIGDGPEMRRLRRLKPDNVDLLGHVDQEALVRHLGAARGFVFAAEEDFGIAPVEAMACGTPVIAYGGGGARETVVEGRTGTFFHDRATPDDLIAAVTRSEQIAWNPAAIRGQALRFTNGAFRSALREQVMSRLPTRATEAAEAVGLGGAQVNDLLADAARGPAAVASRNKPFHPAAE